MTRLRLSTRRGPPRRKNHAFAFGQIEHRPIDIGAQSARCGQALGVVIRVAGDRLGSGGRGFDGLLPPAAALLSSQVMTGVDRDSVKPGRERRIAAETFQPAECTEERFLDNLLGVVVISHQTEGDAVDLGRMLLDQRPEVLPVAGRRSSGQLGVVFGVLHYCRHRQCRTDCCGKRFAGRRRAGVEGLWSLRRRPPFHLSSQDDVSESSLTLRFFSKHCTVCSNKESQSRVRACGAEARAV